MDILWKMDVISGHSVEDGRNKWFGVGGFTSLPVVMKCTELHYKTDWLFHITLFTIALFWGMTLRCLVNRLERCK